MGDKHPYASGTAHIIQMVEHLRKRFPAEVAADTLKKLAIAPKNESYVVNTLRFLGVIDEEGKKTEDAATVFNQHKDDDFHAGFGKLVKAAYAELFSLHGDAAWELDTDALISFFRNSDKTSAAVGRKQATTFQSLAYLSGHGDAPATRDVSKKRAAKPKPKKATETKQKSEGTKDSGAVTDRTSGKSSSRPKDVGLTVRIEVNLPAEGDQKTYDRIFRSIREHLIDAD